MRSRNNVPIGRVIVDLEVAQDRHTCDKLLEDGQKRILSAGRYSRAREKHEMTPADVEGRADVRLELLNVVTSQPIEIEVMERWVRLVILTSTDVPAFGLKMLGSYRVIRDKTSTGITGDSGICSKASQPHVGHRWRHATIFGYDERNAIDSRVIVKDEEENSCSAGETFAKAPKIAGIWTDSMSIFKIGHQREQ